MNCASFKFVEHQTSNIIFQASCGNGQIAVGCTTLLGAWATGINFIVDKKVEPVNQNIKRLDDCVKKLDNKIETSVQKLDNKIETSVKRLDNRIDQLGLKLDYVASRIDEIKGYFECLKGNK